MRIVKPVILFNPVTCEKKLFTVDQIAKIHCVSETTIRTVKSRRQMYHSNYILDIDVTNKELKPLIQGIELENECWKLIPGTVTEVSNWGRYRGPRGIMLIGPDARLSLNMDGKNIGHNAHYWVARLFLGETPPGKKVIHKDGNKYNNKAENLMFASQGQLNKQIASKKSIPVLQLDPQTKEIVEEYSSMSEAAKAVFTTRDTICRAVNRGYESMGYLWIKDTQFV